MAESPPVIIKPFEELSLHELHACLKLRGEVFIVGQQIYCEPDVDEVDPLCHHAMLWQGDELAGTARLLPVKNGRVIKVGRVAVGEPYRGRGLGVALMRAVQDWIAREPGRSGVMSAQGYLKGWYTALGWRPVGEHYDEAGIDHVEMHLDACKG